MCLHEVILKVTPPVLVAALRNSLLIIQEVISMVTLIRFLPPLLLDAFLLLLANLLRRTITDPQLLVAVFSLLTQVRILLHFGLVQTVDDGVESLRDVYSLDLGELVSMGRRWTHVMAKWKNK
jgi:hypothetical protein